MILKCLFGRIKLKQQREKNVIIGKKKPKETPLDENHGGISKALVGQHRNKDAVLPKPNIDFKTRTSVFPEVLGILKNMTKVSFEELLAKYKNKGSTHKWKYRPNKCKDAKASPRYQEQSDFHQPQGNCAVAPYSFVGPITLWSSTYPYQYSPWDFSTMYMQPGHILFNILLHIQIMVHHCDQLLIIVIWSNVIYVPIEETVRRTTSKILII